MRWQEQSFIYLCVCMYVCVCICVHFCACSPVQAGTCGCQRLMSGVLLYHSPLYFFKQGLSQNLKVTSSIRLSGQWDPSICLSPLPSTEVTDSHSLAWLTSELTSSCLGSKHVTHWAISPACQDLPQKKKKHWLFKTCFYTLHKCPKMIGHPYQYSLWK